MVVKAKNWRVRVLRKVEDWVEVQAENGEQAEQLAVNLPYVISVFGKSAISADKPLTTIDPLGVLDDD